MAEFKLAVFISGSGTNLQSILKNQSKFGYKVELVVSNTEKAGGLSFAKQNQIPTIILDWKEKEKSLSDLQLVINKSKIDLLVLAGFMRILPEFFIEKNNNKIINIHPSLLPKYPGLKTHEKVINNNDQVHGATVHFVNEELDSGQIIAQTKINVLDSDTVDSLKNRLLLKEHKLFPYCIGLIREKTVYWNDKNLYFNNKLLNEPLVFHED